MHGRSGMDRESGAGGEVKLFRGGASWGRRGRCAVPPVLVPAALAMWTVCVATQRSSPGQEELRIHPASHIPQQILPQLAAEITALRCWAAATPGKCKAEGQQDLPEASGAGSSAPIPSPTQRSTKDTQITPKASLTSC